MKAYILKDEDFQTLLDNIDRDPSHGLEGGSSQIYTEKEKEAFDKAHGFYNYQIRKWMNDVKK